MGWRDHYDALYVGASRLVGKGLFAGTRIPARAKVGEFEGEVIGLREARRRAKGRAIIAIVELERHALDATRMKHGFRFTPQRAEIYALREIRRGEELTVDYGESQHDGALRCRCGAARCRGYL